MSVLVQTWAWRPQTWNQALPSALPSAGLSSPQTTAKPHAPPLALVPGPSPKPHVCPGSSDCSTSPFHMSAEPGQKGDAARYTAVSRLSLWEGVLKGGTVLSLRLPGHDHLPCTCSHVFHPHLGLVRARRVSVTSCISGVLLPLLSPQRTELGQEGKAPATQVS